MGHKVVRRLYKLSFQPDTGLDGLTVMMRGLSLGQALQLRADNAKRAEGGKESEEATERMVTLLAEHLVEWDAEDEDDVPIPATLEGLLSQDPDFAMKIIEAWQAAIAAVSGPLPRTSTDGQPSVEVSIPMEPLSESLAS